MFSLAKLSPTVTDMIRFDHSHVFVTFHQFTHDKSPTVKKALSETICSALEIHATLEEEIFYPVMRTVDAADPVLEKAPDEHADMKRLIRELRAIPGHDDRHDRVLLELMREVIHHVADEETVVLPAAERRLSKERLNQLGVEMNKRRVELLAPQAGKVAISHAVGFSGSTTAWVLGAVGAIGAVLALATAGRRTAAQH
ncbi:cation-binding protein [Duganella sp. Leaf126]|uniref:hemerythrin domain-containing protein n=1 Tax=Duganella sp. Leaf126 TaxID=1736266 RepID=UPI0006FDE7FA|nr:hemerythrin domain-containing protein [Duganella sp. Leaf126]KQQ40062.1 cation-binding protein [Duganella sp. Leaf126]